MQKTKEKLKCECCGKSSNQLIDGFCFACNYYALITPPKREKGN